MPHEPSREAAWRDLCADLETDDETRNDTKGLHRKRRRSQKHKEDWRDRRLCGQVRRAVQWGLAECADPGLQNLIVLGVEPTDRSSCLCVHLLRPAPAENGGDRDGGATLLARLHAVSPRLRVEVARGLHRKKTPNLIFQLHAEENPDET